MYSEMIIEFDRGSQQGDIWLSGRAGPMWAQTASGLWSGEIFRDDLLLRGAEGWERHFFRSALLGIKPEVSTGPPLRGEESTLWTWSEDYPGWIHIETEETEEIEKWGSFPWSATLSRCYRPDSKTVRFRIPSALFALRGAVAAPLRAAR